jgi:hypothetical protein
VRVRRSLAPCHRRKGALAVIPNNPSRALKYPLDKHLCAQRHLVAASQNSSSSAASQPASKRPPEITAPSSLSQPSSYGCDKCPHRLVLVHVGVTKNTVPGLCGRSRRNTRAIQEFDVPCPLS